MANIIIEYTFKFDRKSQESVLVELDGDSLSLINFSPEILPEWTKLDFNKCSHCPLEKEEQEYCPLASNLVNIIPLFEQLTSFDEIDVQVVSEERMVSQRTSVQRALGSLMGLVIATSGCPHTKFFRAMARFHLPFSSEEETILRASSYYLLAQYFLKKEGERADFDLIKLKDIYYNMQLVNRSIAERLKVASQTDASSNALILLDLFAKAMPYCVEESLEDLKYLFEPYLLEVKKHECK